MNNKNKFFTKTHIMTFGKIYCDRRLCRRVLVLRTSPRIPSIITNRYFRNARLCLSMSKTKASRFSFHSHSFTLSLFSLARASERSLNSNSSEHSSQLFGIRAAVIKYLKIKKNEAN